MIRRLGRSLIVWLVGCVVGLVVFPSVVLGEGESFSGGPGVSPFLGGSLVVPGGLNEGQQVRAVEEARRSSPGAVAARSESQTKYEGLGSGLAAKVVSDVFPDAISHSSGGPPPLPAGEKIVDYPADNAAQVDLGGSRHGVIESLGPIAVEASPGLRVPVDLSLDSVGGAFEPVTPVVGVRIPKRLGEGVRLAHSGVSLTPVDMSGGALEGPEGVLDGASVFYANTQTDADTVVKPVTSGFDAATVLRSVKSPQRLFFRVGMPTGAGLVQSDSTHTVQVVKDGVVIATVAPPVAADATGTSVPVSMAVSGDILALAVDLAPGQYQYPVYVDPTVTDKEVLFNPGNWLFLTDDPEVFRGAGSEGRLTDSEHGSGTYFAGDYGYFSYNTQGASRIYAFVASALEVHRTAPVLDQLYLRNSSWRPEPGNGEEGYAKITEPIHEPEIERTGVTVCRETSCGPVAVSGSENNQANFEQNAYSEGEGKLSYFSMTLTAASVEINQEAAPSASFDTSDSTIEGLPNALLSGKWYKSTSNVIFGVDALDTGIGVFKEGVSSPNKSGWGYTLKNETRNECKGAQCNECYESPCYGKKSGTGKPLTFSLAGATGGELPEGEDTVESKVEDAAGLSASPTAKVKIDNLPPHNITLSGLPGNHEISDGQHFVLKSSATDGAGGTPSAGVASIVLEIDGQQIGGPQGYCSPGPCTGNAEWTLSGENYAAGQHTLSVVATDSAGNVASEEFQVTIHHPESVAVGPGSVNPVTGELSLTATDVSINAPEGGLTVNRSYRSRHVAQGTEGPLGPQWIMSLGAQQSLSRIPGGMVLTSSNGGQIVFVSKGKGEFTSPTGDAGLILLEKTIEGKTVFTLSENGSVTTFELPTGSSGGVWMPSSSEGPNGTGTTLYKFKLASGVIEPTEELAPVPAGVSCGKEISELKEGCRALKFEYDEGETKAKGENASEWNEFAGHLSRVKYIAWNASKAKTETVVSEYAYDTKGRLRAEWNPQVKPAPLKTTYGYEVEGHVTAVSTAGHEPVLLEQGTIPSDASPGRLLAVAIPSATTSLGSGEAPVNTEAPTLSSTKPAVGAKISVSLSSEKTPGKWSAGPLAFIYQWEDCNSSGKECTPIPGAVNEAYYPVAGDEGHTLVVEAIALNATGAVTASSAPTSTVASGTPKTLPPEPPSVGSDSVSTLEYQVPVSGSGAPYEMNSTELAKWGQSDDPSEAMAIFPPDKVMGWPAKEYKRETVYYLDGKDRAVNTALPTGGIATTEYNPYNDPVRTLSPDNRAAALKESCKAEKECKSAEVSNLLDTKRIYEEKGSEPGTELLSTLGPQHTVKLAVGKEGKTNEEALARAHTNYSYNEGAPSEGGPYHLVTKTVEGAETASKEEFDKRTTTTSYSGQENLGWKLRKPTLITTDPSGLHLTHRMVYNKVTGNTIETRMPAAETSLLTYASQFGSKGTGNGQFEEPRDVALDPKGNVLVLDTNNQRVQKFSATGTYLSQFGTHGTGNGEFLVPKGIAIDTKGKIWIADQENNCVQEFNEEGKFLLKVTTANGKAFSAPQGVATDSENNVYIADKANRRIVVLNESGGYVAEFGTSGSGNGQFKEPTGVAVDSNNNVFVADTGNNRVQKFNSKLEYVTQFGSAGSSNAQFKEPKGIAVDQAGNVWVADSLNTRLEEFTPYGEYLGQYGSSGTGNGQFKEPRGIAVNSAGTMWVVDVTNNRVEQFQQGTPHDTRTIYYTAKGEAEISACREHPEWANLPCETMPVVQPGTSELPELPTKKFTYNIWGETETTTETVGSTTRTKTETYDPAGRPATEAFSSTIGKALPTVTYEYNATSGALEKQSTTVEGKTKTITRVENKLGELESYTDADENKTTYEYDIAGRITKTNDGKGTQTVTFNETTGLPSELVDSSHEGMKFTATFDVEGNPLTEGYPNGMTVTHTYNSVNQATALEYKKTTHCTEKCVWFSDSIIPSIHGQWLEQTSTLSHQIYSYDNAGRITQVQNTPAGQGCTTRIYTNDEDTNRTSLTTREPGVEGKCTTEGGKAESHTYDTADRLTDTGIAYSPFGNITTLPATDAEGHTLTSAYYTDNQLATQEQNGQTIGYNLDPAYRTRETISTGKQNSDIISHYPGPGNTPAWTNNPTSGEWSRNILGISGNLIAIQNNSETPELQITNLHGDIIAKAYLSETATGFAAKADTSEFGVPTTTLPAKYSWLGAIQLPTELPSGIITMGTRSYVPQLGRFLQPDPIPGGSANAYSYTFGDPINSTDPTGAYANTASTATLLALQGQGIAAQRSGERRRAEREAAEKYAAEQAARAAAEAAAAEAAAAAAAAGPQYEEGGGEEWEEWEEEEGEYEYAVYQRSSKANNGEFQKESATLIQAFNTEAVKGNQSSGLSAPACQPSVQGPCTRDVGGYRGHKHHHYTKQEIEQFEHGKCQTIGVGIAVAGYFIPESRLAKAILAGIGIGTSLSC